MSKLVAVPLLLVALLLGACDKNPFARENPKVAGAWIATPPLGWVLDITTSETDRAITGTGTLAYGDYSIPLTVTGTNAYPKVSMTLSSTGYEPIGFQGTFSDKNTISGKLNGSGWQGEAFTLVRK